MTQQIDSFHELIQMVKYAIQEDYQGADWIVSDPETCDIFRQFAIQNRKPQQKATQPPPAKAPPPKPKLLMKPRPPVTRRQPVQKQQQERSKVEEITLTKSDTCDKTTPHFKEFQEILNNKFPQIKILEEIPDDKKASDLCNQWKRRKEAEVVILVNGIVGPELKLLENLAHAIDRCYYPTITSVEKEDKPLRLVISCTTPTDIPEGEKHYHIEDPSQYLTNPKLKQTLWKEIVDLLKS